MIKRLHGFKISEIHKSFQSVIQAIYEVIKAHGGEIKVETVEEAGSTFIICLQLKSD